jgi:tetratricopeptide (TPR) repeat protein
MGDGDLAAAATIVEKELEADPNSLRFLILLARIRISQNRYSDAVEATDKAIGVSARSAEAYGLKARARFLANNTTRALASAKKAVSLAPNQARWQRILGEIYLARGKPRSALKVLNRAAELDRKSGWTLVLRGDALWALDQYNQAMSAYRKASALTRDGKVWQAEALDKLASLLKARRQARKAREVLAECKKKYPAFGCPHAEAALSPPDPTRPHRRETYVRPPGARPAESRPADARK